MIKLPSIQSLATQVNTLLKRFPLTVLSSVLLASSLISLTHQHWDFTEHGAFFWGKLSMCSGLGLSLFLAGSLLSEAKGYSLKNRIIIQLLILGIIVIYYFTIERYENFNIDSFTRYTLYIIAAHLFVAFAPFTDANRINGFWQFNKTIFLRFLLSGLYTCVLYGGISLALWLIDDLLHIEIQYTKYIYLWYLLSGILNTLIFLAGIPKDLAELENNTFYPKGLKTFTQFVLLPLVTVYLIILYAYFSKIIINWSLPKGYVSYLVISFSIMGILSLLLIYPIRNSEENKWIKIFSRWFYVALYPLIILLGVSIYHRISDYGITEHRYFILILAAWLVFTSSYFLLSKKDNIKIIPITLFALALLTSSGPLGAFSIAHHSQKNRLEKLLINDGILVNGKVITTVKKVDGTDENNIRSILQYMQEVNALNLIQPWFSRNLDSIHTSKWGYNDKTDTILQIIGVSEPSDNSSEGSFELVSHTTVSINVKGFEYYSVFSYRASIPDSSILDTTKNFGYFMIGTDSIAFVPYKQPLKYGLIKYRKTIAVLNLYNLVTTLHAQSGTTNGYYYYILPDKFTYEVTGADSMVYQFRFNSIDVEKKYNQSFIDNIDAAVLTKHL